MPGESLEVWSFAEVGSLWTLILPGVDWEIYWELLDLEPDAGWDDIKWWLELESGIKLWSKLELDTRLGLDLEFDNVWIGAKLLKLDLELDTACKRPEDWLELEHEMAWIGAWIGTKLWLELELTAWTGIKLLLLFVAEFDIVWNTVWIGTKLLTPEMEPEIDTRLLLELEPGTAGIGTKFLVDSNLLELEPGTVWIGTKLTEVGTVWIGKTLLLMPEPTKFLEPDTAGIGTKLLPELELEVGCIIDARLRAELELKLLELELDRRGERLLLDPEFDVEVDKTETAWRYSCSSAVCKVVPCEETPPSSSLVGSESEYKNSSCWVLRLVVLRFLAGDLVGVADDEPMASCIMREVVLSEADDGSRSNACFFSILKEIIMAFKCTTLAIRVHWGG